MFTLPNSPYFGITKCSGLIPLSLSSDNGIIGNAPPKDDSDERRDFLTHIERFREETERNVAKFQFAIY
jgi:hypothetical protein